MYEKELPLTESMFFILLALRHPSHGYGVTQEVEALTGGRVVLGAGTLYGALKTMQKKDWIRLLDTARDPRGKKEYQITETGRNLLEAETARMKEAVQTAERVMHHEEI